MTRYSDHMRNYMTLLERDTENPGEVPYVGAHVGNKDISYKVEKTKGEITKVIATLSGHASGKYTKLAQNIQRMQEIAQETLELEQSIEDESKEAIADLFNAEDIAYTRVVETVSFILSLSKNPKAATTVKYAEVLKELETKLTPELLEVLNNIKQKFSTVQKPKPPTLKYEPKVGGVGSKKESVGEEIVNESPLFSKMRSYFKQYLDKITNWGQKYDAKLEALKASMNISDVPQFESRLPPGEDLNKMLKEGFLDPNPNQIAKEVFSVLDHSMKIGHYEPTDMKMGSGASFTMMIDDSHVYEITVRQINN